jgi:Fe-S-cluster containining protein
MPLAAAAGPCKGGSLRMPNSPDVLPACAGCGKCCHLLVELAPGCDEVPEEFVVEHEGVRCMDQRGDGACVALDPDTQRCTIYEHRPQVCRDFERGSALCRKILIGRHALR